MDPRTKQAVELISEHLQSRFTVDEIAAAVGLSVSQFTRLFRRDTGRTPSSFTNQLRMERAAILLERTSLSVMEVMAQVGATDPSHFSRDFRRAHGFNPRTFRQHLRHSGASLSRAVGDTSILARRPSHTNNREDDICMTRSRAHPAGVLAWPPEVRMNGEPAAPAPSEQADDRRSGRKDRRRHTRADRRRGAGNLP